VNFRFDTPRPRTRSPPPAVWRANFYRTDTRKGMSDQEFTAWSPTLVQPPAFHVPEYFGVLILGAAATGATTGGGESH
jgi:hypothetical protein